MTRRLTTNGTLLTLGAALSLAAAFSAGPAGAGTPDDITVFMQNIGLGTNVTTRPQQGDLFDNFDLSPTTIGNPIIEFGAVSLDAEYLIDSEGLVQLALGLDGPMTDSDDSPLDEVIRDLRVALAQEELRRAGPDSPLVDDFIIAATDPAVPPPQPLLDATDRGVDDALSALGLVTQEQVEGLGLAQHRSDPSAPLFFFDSAEPSFEDQSLEELLDLFPEADTVRGGPDVFVLRQREPFMAPTPVGRAENVFRFVLPSPIVLPDGNTIGGGPAYNGSFAGDIFNGANAILGVRHQVTDLKGATPSEVEVFAFAYEDGLWSSVEPFGDVAVVGRDTIFVVPDGMLDVAAGFGFAAQAPGAVGSSVDDEFPGFFDPALVVPYMGPAVELPTLDELLERLRTEIAAASPTEDGAGESDEPVDDEEPAGDDSASLPEGTPEATGDGEPDTSGTDTTGGGNSSDGSFRIWVPVLVIGLGLAIGGFWIYYRTRERKKPDDGGRHRGTGDRGSAGRGHRGRRRPEGGTVAGSV